MSESTGRSRVTRRWLIRGGVAAAVSAWVGVRTYPQWMKGLSALTGNPAGTCACAAAAAGLTSCLLAALLVVGLTLWESRGSRPRLQTAFRILLAVSVSLFWTATFFPALMTNDSIDQWLQARENRYTAWHPPLMAMLMHLGQQVSGSPALFAVIQSGLFWAAAYRALGFFLPSPRWFVASCVALSCNPALWICASVLWKDVWVAICIMALLPLLVAAAQRSSPRHLAGATACAAAAACFRSNAVTLWAALAVVGWVYVWRSRRPWRKIVAAGVLAIAVVIPSRLVSAMPSVHNEGTSAVMIVCEYIGTASRMDRQSPEYAAERSRFDGVFGPGKLDACTAGYIQHLPLTDYFLFSSPPIVSRFELMEHRAFVLRATAGIAFRHPLLYMRQKLSMLAMLLQVPPHDVWLPYYTGIEPWGAPFGLRSCSLLPDVRQAIVAILHGQRNGPLFRHVLFVGWIAVSLFVGRRHLPTSIASLVGVAYGAGFVMATVAADWRFLIGTYLCAWIGGLSFLSTVRRRSVPPASGAPATE